MYSYKTASNTTKNILETLLKTKRPMRLYEIADAVDKPRKNVGSTLNVMRQKGIVKKVSLGTYALDMDKEQMDKLRDGVEFKYKVEHPVEIWPYRKFLVSLINGINCSKDRKENEDLHVEYLEDMYLSQDGKCAITGLIMTTVRGQKIRCPLNISIDRIDSSLPYRKGNVQLVCSAVNLMKHDLTIDELKLFAKMIVRGSHDR